MAQSDPLIGATLDGKYRIEALLGSGSMGTVYRARHLSLESWRAIKVMRAELARDAVFVERFQREARLLEELRHPHLVALYDFAQLPDGAWYIVSEFVEGETLAACLARSRTLATGEAVRLFAQLADGVAAAHAKGIVHRDLSPDNIMISGAPPDLTAKVLDFGVAKSVLREAPTGTDYSLVVGKVGYAAPEQMGFLANVQEIDARADVFALAAVLYRTLFGTLPWRVDSLQSYVHDLLIRPQDDLSREIVRDIPACWQAVFLRALARTPSERTASMEELRQEISHVGTLVTSETGTAARGRRRGLAVGASVLAAIALIVSSIVVMETRSRQPASARPLRSLAEGTSLDTTASPSPPDATPPDTPVSRSAASPPARRAAADPLRAARPVGTPNPPAPLPDARSAEPANTPIASATLLIRSASPAQVRVDGELRGRTPLDLSLAPGAHRLLLLSDDGEEDAVRLELASGQVLEHNHHFAGFGKLAVVAEPWIEVSLDDGPFRETPVYFDRAQAGPHKIRGRRPGFAPVELEVSVEKGQTRSVRIDPRPLRGSE